MNLTAALVTTHPDNLNTLARDIAEFEWAEVRLTDAEGRLIVLIEGETTETEIDRLKQLRRLHGVLFAEMVVHCFEEETEHAPAPAPQAAVEFLNDGPADSAKSFYQRMKALGNY